MHSTANPDQEIDDLKKEVVKLKTQIKAIFVHQPKTIVRLQNIEITAQDIFKRK
jgi:hypothetical protein